MFRKNAMDAVCSRRQIRRWRATAWTMAVAALASAMPVLTHAEVFTVVALPDTQNYSDNYPHIYNSQTQWIVDNAAAKNIKFVTHLGDVTNNQDDIRQWNNADAAMRILDNANMPYGIAYGNHDIHYGGSSGDVADYNATNYINYFGPQRYAGKSWYGGASPSKQSNYQVISYNDAGVTKQMLFLHIAVETPAAELAWAQGVINANRDKAVMLTTHRYMQDSEHYAGGIGTALGVPPGRYPNIWYEVAEPLYRPDGIEGEVLWNSFIKPNKNIFMVNCGHFHAEYRMTENNNYGLPVHELLVDYQDDTNGGNGFLRTMQFNTDTNQIYVQSYSPYTNSYQTDSESQFTLSTNLDAYTYAAGTTAIRFQNGVGGYNGTIDTWINENSKGSSYGTNGTMQVDDDTSNSAFGEKQGQGLVKFNDLFLGANVYEGDATPTKIPLNAVITKANLMINVTEDVELDRTFEVWTLNKAWDEGSTWNSLGNMANSRGTHLATFEGDNDPNGQTIRTMDVLSAVNGWKNGTANNGFLIWAPTKDWHDDGIDVASSENGDISLRPALDIEFTYTVLNRAPTINQTLKANGQTTITINQGDTFTLSMQATDANPLDPLLFKIDGSDMSYATGSGTMSQLLKAIRRGTFTMNGQVADDEAIVGAGSVTVIVQNVASTVDSTTIENIQDGSLKLLKGATIHLSMKATDLGDDTITFTIDGQSAGSDAAGTGQRSSGTVSRRMGQYSRDYALNFDANDGMATTRSTSHLVVGMASAKLSGEHGRSFDDANGLHAVVTAGTSLADLSSMTQGDANGTMGSEAIIRAGLNGASQRIIGMNWRTRAQDEFGSTATTPPMQFGHQIGSDVVELSGLDHVAFALEMTYGNMPESDEMRLIEHDGIFLARLDDAGMWMQAHDQLLAGVGSMARSAQQMSWATFAATYGVTDANLAQFLGSWGVDAQSNRVWAVLDQGGQFAAIPEPTSAICLLSLAAAGLVLVRRR